MTRYFILLSLLLLLTNCKQSKHSAQPKQSYQFNKAQEESIYSLINDFIIDTLFRVELMAIETAIFWNTDLDSTGPTRGPAFEIPFNHNLLETLVTKKIIDSIDLKSFEKQMSQNEEFLLDSAKLKIKTFSRDYMHQMYEQDHRFEIYDYLKKEYNTSGFITLSKPVISTDNNIILISVSIFPGGWGGHGEIFALKRIKNKWKILYRKRTWMS